MSKAKTRTRETPENRAQIGVVKVSPEAMADIRQMSGRFTVNLGRAVEIAIDAFNSLPVERQRELVDRQANPSASSPPRH